MGVMTSVVYFPFKCQLGYVGFATDATQAVPGNWFWQQHGISFASQLVFRCSAEQTDCRMFDRFLSKYLICKGQRKHNPDPSVGQVLKSEICGVYCSSYVYLPPLPSSCLSIPLILLVFLISGHHHEPPRPDRQRVCARAGLPHLPHCRQVL